ncbi:MAG TPA: aminodeoxychorismate synthase component I [Gammaproteobacteria bacterium]|nr:aminodeoxychorismate synthase component I [Gammaproteobacteria bacterium]
MSPRLTPLPYWADATPLFERLRRLTWPIWLDSGHPRAQGGRWDILAADPQWRVQVVGRTLEFSGPDGTKQNPQPADALDLIATLLARLDPSPVAGLPFTGGALGYFGYDWGRQLEGLAVPRQDDILLPDLAIGIYGWAVVTDHAEGRSWLVEQPGHAAPRALLSPDRPVTPAAYGPSFQVLSAVGPDMPRELYARGFARIQHYLREGDCYQVNFTQRFSARHKGDPWDAYCRLRARNPAPFSAYLQLAEGAILCSSPERFLRLTERRVETRPIKGTRRRVHDEVADAAVLAELASSDKDRAENVMIVDLLRNDLGKTCEIGSVRVPQLFATESYARVHHLVSTVTGRLRADLGPLDLLRGAFPGGSITGAPKRRAMQIIDELEPHRRSVYCGSIGYLSAHGDMDLNIAIRTLVCSAGRAYCWAGGGIVLDSMLEAEYQESFDKASAMLDVFHDSEAPGVGG